MFKRFVSFLLGILLVFNYLPITVFAQNLNEDRVRAQANDRYTVLVLDVSGSMAGDPIKALKEAVKKFNEQVVKNNSNNYTAIVSFGDSARLMCDFTNDLDELNAAADKLSTGGGTSMTSGLAKADELLLNIPSSATRNILIFSDGLPNSQSSVIDKFDEITNDYNIYTLGFFQELSSNEKVKCREFLQRIQNKKFWEVNNINDLQFAFDDAASTITESELKELFIQQHKDFIKSREYETQIVGGFQNSLDDTMSDINEDSSMGSYNYLNNLNDLLHLDLDLTDEYEILLAEIMFSENEVFNFQENYLVNLQDVEEDISTALLAEMDQLISPDQAIVANEMKDCINRINSNMYFDDAKKAAETRYMELVDQSISLDQMKGIIDSLSVAVDLSNVAFKSASELINYVTYAEAYLRTNDAFRAVLAVMEVNSNSPFRDYHPTISCTEPAGNNILSSIGLNAAINDFIQSMDDYKNDNAKAVSENFKNSIISEGSKLAANEALDFLMSKIPIIKAIPILKDALDAGISLVNLVSGIDERAYAANMFVKLYYMTILSREGIDNFETLISQNEPDLNKAFNSAVWFDEAIGVHKNILKLACRYAKDYQNCVIDKLFESHKGKDTAGLTITGIQLENDLLNSLNCHSAALVYDHKSNALTYDESRLNVFVIECPVTVTVRDDHNSQFATISDSGVNAKAGYENYFFTYPEENKSTMAKVAVVPEDYTISFEGTGNGTVDIYMGKAVNNEIVNSESFTDIPITNSSKGTVENDSSNSFDVVIDNNEIKPDGSPQPEQPEQPSKPDTPSQPETTVKVPIYRLYNSTSGEHLYTSDRNEYDTLPNYGWTQEGIGWNSPSSGQGVYRLFNPELSDHLYTTDKNEVDVLTHDRGWQTDYNGIPLFYSGGSVPVYRLYNTVNYRHHLTTDTNEYNVLPAYNWSQEGPKLYALGNNDTSSQPQNPTTPDQPNPTVSLKSLKLNTEQLSLKEGETSQLSITYNPSNTTEKDVFWESNNSSIATISSNGLVKAVGSGSTNITVTSKNNTNIYATCRITVTKDNVKVRSITLSHTTYSGKEGEQFRLSAHTEPSDATNSKIDWKSSDTSVCTVDSNGLVKLEAPGDARITASTTDGSNLNASCSVHVDELDKEVPVTGVLLNSTNEEIGVGGSVQLVARVLPNGASDQNVSWSSSDTSVATVNTNGLVKGVSEGTTTIKVETHDGNYVDQCTVKVVGKTIEVSGITVTPTSVQLNVGQTSQLKVNITPNNATNKDVSYHSSSPSVATVTADGLITAVGKGNATILVVADDNGLTAMCEVSVIESNGNYSTPDSEISGKIHYEGDNTGEAHVSTDKNEYTISPGNTLNIAATFTMPEKAVQNEHKYIGYMAYLKGYSWEQVGSFYLDGGTAEANIAFKINSWPKGRYHFVLSIFPKDKFSTGNALYNHDFYITVK